MNNILNKIKERKEGIIYIFIALAIYILNKINIIRDIYNSLSYTNYFDSYFRYAFGIAVPVLIVIGLVKFFSKSKKETFTEIGNVDLEIKSLKRKGIIFLCVGIFAFILIFILFILFKYSLLTNLGPILILLGFMLSGIILVLGIGGFTFIIIGLNKLSKYFRYKKSLKIDNKN